MFFENIVQNDGIHYENVTTAEDGSGSPKEVGTSYTDCTVQAFDSNKGEPQIADPIMLVKQGGVRQNQRAVFVFENDAIQQGNGACIF